MTNLLTHLNRNVVIISAVLFNIFSHYFDVLKVYFNHNVVPKLKALSKEDRPINDHVPTDLEIKSKNIADILGILKQNAATAEAEYASFIKNFKTIKDQNLHQESINKAESEINLLKEESVRLNSNFQENLAEIKELKSLLHRKEEELADAEDKFNIVAKEVSVLAFPESHSDFEKKEVEENYKFIVDNLQHMKDKISSQNNLIKKMFSITHKLDQVNEVNKNINEQNEKINSLKINLRRKSDSLVVNLKNIAGRLKTSKDAESQLELNASLSKAVESTDLFLQNLNCDYDLIKQQNDNIDDVFMDSLNDLWQETSVTTVINTKVKDTKKKNMRNIVLNKNHLKRASNKSRPIDCGCQTSSTGESHEIIKMKNEIRTAQEKSDVLKTKYENLKKKYSDYKIEKNKELIVVSNIKKQLFTQEENNSVLKKELEDEKKKNEEKSIFIAKLQHALKSMKNNYEALKYAQKDTEGSSEKYMNILDEEQKKYQKIINRYTTMAKSLLLQIETQKKSISDKEKESEELIHLIDCLNKKMNSLKLECENRIKKKEATLIAYRNSFKQKFAEIKCLKEENQKLKVKLQDSKTYSKPPLKEININTYQNKNNNNNNNQTLARKKDAQAAENARNRPKYPAETSPYITFRSRKTSKDNNLK